MPFTRKQRIYLLERYLATKSYSDTITAFTAEYEDAQVPNKSSISWLVKKFRETGSVMNAPKNQTRTVFTPEKVEEIGATFSDTPHSSICKVARRMGTSIKSTHCTTRPLKLYLYNVSVLHEVNPADCLKCIEFCKWLLHLSHDNITVFDKFFFSDEAWVQMNGYVNSQNYRTWSIENLHEYCEAGLHPPQVGVWCAISWRQIVGPIFFTTTITSDMYADILMQFIVLFEEDERDCIFQRDSAQPHMLKESMAILCGFFSDRLVSTSLTPQSGFVPPGLFLVEDTWLITFLKWSYRMRTFSAKELWKKVNESRLTPSVWYSEVFDDGHSCAKMFWEPSSNTFYKIKPFSFLQCSVFVGCEF